MHRMAICLLLTVLLLSGCTLAPHYSRPEAPVPTSWAADANLEGDKDPAAPAYAAMSWQDFFVDGNLKELIRLALESNRDLRVTALTIERTRAQYRIQRSELFPGLQAGAGYNRQRVPDTSGFGRVIHLEQYNVSLATTAWEIDFFGRLRSLKKQALQTYLASEEAYRSARLALVSEVARAYLVLAADRERRQLAEETLASYRETLALTQRRYDAGVASELDLRQAQTSVEAARVDRARYDSLVAEGENALRQLVGQEFPPDLLPAAPVTELAAVTEIPAGVPSEVLQQRPDILAAEYQLKAAYANIGAARAAFFPRIALTASAGFGSSELSTLFDDASRAWAFSPRLDLPIFTAGSLRARLQVSKVDREISLARYEGAIQGAFREVADALVRQETIVDQLQAQQALVEATAATYNLSELRYTRGVDSFLSLLDSQRSLYGARQGLVAVRLARLENLVSLYKVLGGGAF
ncbi:efflux transporter outer membrane subunit [Desulfuromonas sp. AOP6]|uniref:efflux transporter outer membrane subunit n=1 Tax=Desulfuromonas sp. AOP6 TaxID=1566351 RepID=UPI001279C5DF|nr:efflux transporter outer membrane subunit [Desulfuromonas sp. AOP6]BCA81174.1 adeC/adeK/oprM family multidrug efflux complex outer membrane factor/adeK [Desulfuromonas sp. AOP6]